MKPLLTALLLLVFCNCIAQRNSDSLFFAKMHDRKISLPQEAHNTISNLPFNDIHIIDARPDTTSIGFLKAGGVTTRLNFQKNFSSAFHMYVQQNYHLSNDSNNLVILIKAFRITQYAQSDENATQWKGGCLISCELFLFNNNHYHALYRIDTVLIRLPRGETISELVAESFRTILKKSENRNLSEMHIGKTAFLFADIQKHLNNFFNFPIVKDSILKKGVYKNFNEFKLNKPSIVNYEVQKGKLSDELYVTENNQTYPLQGFWGYCDGKNLFIRSANNLFQLIKTNNTFNVRASKLVSVEEDFGKELLAGVAEAAIFPNAAYAVPNISKYDIKLNAFQLNMENGEIY